MRGAGLHESESPTVVPAHSRSSVNSVRRREIQGSECSTFIRFHP